MRSLARAALLISLSCFSACAKQAPPPAEPPPPPPAPTEEELVVQSVPSGASVSFSTGERCTTPCKMMRSFKEPFSVTVSKEDYKSATVKVTSNVEKLLQYNRKWAASEAELNKMRASITNEKLVPNPVTVTLEPEWSR